ncbi:AIR carboxylase-domain-containing protein [Gorgonomyces haynaldii]|nr:AIR carboxylase-domain-containing protein [Gorgonomyces haynaldii]
MQHFSSNKMQTVGILGGGQLGRMMAEAGHRLGIKTIVLDKEDCPAGQLTELVVGSFQNHEDVLKLSKKADVLTCEIEHINTDVLKGLNVEPKASTYEMIKDKYLQKEFLKDKQLPLGEFHAVSNVQDIQALGEKWGYPLMLKSRTLAYDGRGNYVIKTKEDCQAGLDALSAGSKQLYCEKWVPFKKELAVMVAKSTRGEIATYPCVETVQRDNICHLVICPAQIDGLLETKCRNIAEQVVSHLEGAGIFGIEFFLTNHNEILINEIAPRPHNSGHYTIEACETSQFEQHLRCVTGRPLGSTKLKVPASIMINLIGNSDKMEDIMKPCNESLLIPGATLHWYGKQECRKGRKMAHVTLVGEDMQTLFKHTAVLADATPPQNLRPLVGIIMGSDSDLPTVKPAAVILDSFGIPFEIDIVSAHRTPDRMCQYAKSAHERGIQVIIAAAGGAAHLPGMVAAQTPLPVIGIPVALKFLDGVDSLHSIVQMPRGVPVATVAINNAVNAALLAIRILGATRPEYQQRLLTYAKLQEEQVMEKVATLSRIGWEAYK